MILTYACCAMLLYTFRNKSSKTLLIGAGVCLLLMGVRENVDLIRNKNIITKGEAVSRLDTSSVKLTREQITDLNAMKAFENRTSLENRKKIAENSLYQVSSGYSNLYKYQTSRGMDIFMYLAYYQIWSLLLFMFIGMAFYKNGILTGKASSKLYWLLFIIGLGGGLAISWYRIQMLMQYDFNSFNYTKNILFNINEIGRVFLSLGIFGLIMLMYKSGF